jgi:hypothetical protein
MKELDILGSRNATPGDFQAVTEMLAAGRLPPLAPPSPPGAKTPPPKSRSRSGSLKSA